MMRELAVWLLLLTIVICPFRCGMGGMPSCSGCAVTSAESDACCDHHAATTTRTGDDACGPHTCDLANSGFPVDPSEPCQCRTCICCGAVLSDNREGWLTDVSLTGSVQPLADLWRFGFGLREQHFAVWTGPLIKPGSPTGRTARIVFQSWQI